MIKLKNTTGAQLWGKWWLVCAFNASAPALFAVHRGKIDVELEQTANAKARLACYIDDTERWTHHPPLWRPPWPWCARQWSWRRRKTCACCWSTWSGQTLVCCPCSGPLAGAIPGPGRPPPRSPATSGCAPPGPQCPRRPRPRPDPGRAGPRREVGSRPRRMARRQQGGHSDGWKEIKVYQNCSCRNVASDSGECRAKEVYCCIVDADTNIVIKFI